MSLLKLINVSKIYKMDGIEVKALDDVSLEIKKGEFLAIMGPSGSGKSTLMHLIGCLDRPTKGKIILNGKDISNLSEKELAKIRNKEIGFVFQAFNLLPRTSALENVVLPLIYANVNNKKRYLLAKELLNKVGLGQRLSHLPSQLSGGQQQKVAIARALVNNPSIILADEPTGNLDSKSSKEIMSLFVKINQEGNTVVIVTHEEEVAKYAKRIVRIYDGKIVGSK